MTEPHKQTEPQSIHRRACDQRQLEQLAEIFAWKLQPGWTLALHGDLGAGKTTFARALIRAALCDPFAEIPSPTFALVQSYETARIPLTHADLYRLEGGEALEELGLEDALWQGAAVVEWPERAGNALPGIIIDVAISETVGAPDHRDIAITARNQTTHKHCRRIAEIAAFLADAETRGGPALDTITFLQGDASSRSYARAQTRDRRPVILMDAPAMPDGPPVRAGKPYSRLAHLAENVKPFIAIANALRERGLSAPELYACDADRGLLIIEHLGARVFGGELANAEADGTRARVQRMMWTAAVETLVELRASGPPMKPVAAHGPAHTLPRMDTDVLAIEAELLLDWYWPVVKAGTPDASARDDFSKAWAPIFERLSNLPSGWALRDFHSPNLIWRPEREGPARVGLIDFQDALEAHWAYDLVSLTQDARVDVPADLERDLFEHYCGVCRSRLGSLDDGEMAFAYAAFGAQRATKIIGIFARLAIRDGKPHYLAHIPRLWDYLARNLLHCALTDVKTWFDIHFPPALRRLDTVAANQSDATEKP